ncbi:MAG: tetratricopeptide repeat protein [Planctomycetes bacterium]|nr:tetratricopeptide repeat protein [Planctomycetota bacterium]
MRAARLAPALLTVLLAACGTAQAPPPTPPAQGNTLALRERAFGAENQGRFREAADAFLELVTAEPNRVEWTVAAGRCLGRSGRYRDAIDLLDGAQQRFPGVIDVPAMLARTYLLQGELDPGVGDRRGLWLRAAELAEGVLRLEPKHEDSRLILCQALYQLGDFAGAQAQAEQAVQQHPQRPGAYILLGRVHLDHCRALHQGLAATDLKEQARADLVGRLEENRRAATTAFQKAANLDPSRAHPHVLLAQLAQLDGRDRQAAEHLLAALAIEPEGVADQAPIDAAFAPEARAKAYADALQAYAARPGATPKKQAVLCFHRGRALYQGGLWQAGYDAFAQALVLDPTATNNHYYALFCAFHLERLELAEQHAAAFAAVSAPAFAAIVQKLAEAPRVEATALLQYLADRAYRGGRLPAARDLLHTVAVLLDTADAWNNCALACRDTGQFERALDAYRAALAQEPESPQLLNDYAVVLHRHVANEANLARARGLYERAIALADLQLKDPALPAAVRARTEQARQDARQNLADLPR